MRFADLASLVISNLRRMKLRLALTSLGVVIGTSAIVLMVSLGIGLQANLTAELGDIGAATHITVMGGVMMDSGSEPPPLNDKVLDQFRGLESVEAVMPMQYAMVNQASYKRYVLYPQAQGVDMDAFESFGYVLAEGRLPVRDDELLLGASVPSSFSSGDGSEGPSQGIPALDLLGKKLTFTVTTWPDEATMQKDPNVQPTESKKKFTVVGILEPTDMQTDQTVFMTLNAVLDINGMDTRKVTYENVIVKADSVKNVAAVEQAIKDMGFATFSAQSLQDELKTVFLIIQGVLGALGGIAMLVAALGIANTMTMSIYERTREIGIMKAVGASNKQIKRVFLGEAAIIGVLGGIGGLVFSSAGASLANLFVASFVAQRSSGGASPAQQQSFFQISPVLAVFAIAFAAGVGLLAGVLPAVRAANLDPLTALRHE